MPLGTTIGIGGHGVGVGLSPVDTTPLEPLTRPFANPPTGMPTPPRAAVMPPNDEEEIEEPGVLVIGTPGANAAVEDMVADDYPIPKYGEGAVHGGVPNIEAGSATDRKTKPPRAPQDQKQGVITFDEIDRKVRRDKIYNPDDESQWVICEVAESVRLRISASGGTPLSFQVPGAGGKTQTITIPNILESLNGFIVKMNLKPGPPPPKPGS